jgi:rubrerythrin
MVFTRQRAIRDGSQVEAFSSLLTLEERNPKPRSQKNSNGNMEVEKMKSKADKWVCAHCGYEASGRFAGDICPDCGLTFWECGKCGYLFTAAIPPDS